ncbi:carcinine hydrolase/isopenicillin-N N-acyltransferase family protein [Porifericola rhodea]|uniref:carcinine hydrolase/isopenicillin-N N-acyltransferase family protein n=1 Tax=Porifericola rhodea TaxID=930972 RepID=UPI00266657A0|nr:carcinine hydrolase/isopenicillin-N N-acyltransferase family protein [Porifericola rhodea]WKN30393.1 carcinine hydrolase/isopenicillin-N N-acyltransferase family protein [Porifericola rhodea]
MFRILFLIPALLVITTINLVACSVLYYVDKKSGKIYVANHEDYWYDVKAYLRVIPAKKNKLARLWYGWDDFAQGGINEAGLFFDGAVTPEEERPEGYHPPKGNLGDELLANCKNVEEALNFLESRKIALNNAHMMLGDQNGQAVVVEWVRGKKQLVWLEESTHLTMTNFHLSTTPDDDVVCPRYQAIEQAIEQMENSVTDIDLLNVGNTLAGAAQPARANQEGKLGGTLYSSFINLTDMEFYLVYQLDNNKVTRLMLNEVFEENKRKKIRLR